MKINQKFHVWFWLNHRRIKDEGSRLYMRITVDGVRAEVATTHYIKKAQWNESQGRMKITAPMNVQINSFIDYSRNEVKKHFLNMTQDGNQVNAAQLKNRYLSIDDTPKQKTFMDAFNYHHKKMSDLVAVGKYSEKTLEHYDITQNKVELFMKKTYKISDINLDAIRLKFATEFDHFLMTYYGMHSNTSHKYIKNLKKILNVAVGLEWLPSNPIQLFKCTYINPDREVLTPLELEAIINKEFRIKRLEEVRDIFVFCCYTGFAFNEMSRFETSDIFIGIDGEKWLSTNRQKTGTKEGIPLLPIVLDIIEKYENHPYCLKKNKLLPVKSYDKYNSYLDEVAALSGVDKHLTTHIARHTFATTVALLNGISMESVSQMLGHKSISTTQVYAKVLQQKVSQEMKELKDKLFGEKQKKTMKVVS